MGMNGMQPQNNAGTVGNLHHTPTTLTPSLQHPFWPQVVNINGMLYAVHAASSYPHIPIKTTPILQSSQDSVNPTVVVEPPLNPATHIEALQQEGEQLLEHIPQGQAHGNIPPQPPAADPELRNDHNQNAFFLIAKLAVLLFMFCQNASITRIVVLHLAALLVFVGQMGYIQVPSWKPLDQAQEPLNPSNSDATQLSGLSAATEPPAFHHQLLDIVSAFLVSLIPDHDRVPEDNAANPFRAM
ncbi:expressed protein [Batrachochytrium dendrobatidis JAM81]|uniref:Expressed protein n=2 Tax=Batrachochytrium dendrobatidis TaxID=109871 RepID=F4NUK4_BATDJ|nr:uncharacterized protein BATDEDRAFT_36559 [Batrachochytrium dendrobatidis JAM81]EGF84427.1 expressed protein [Batrachochytrium dendrobatidis JAM81]OAJ37476.1 hypothetical protein BDEG_21491 [Batrachochytrium dendrobatidis JEL423]|eukprot:XP_006675901.1 expressed protein [Batrachochytrium dendrobatidis JAM81]